MRDPLEPLLAIAQTGIRARHLLSGAMWCAEPDAPAARTFAQMHERNYDVAPLAEDVIGRYVTREDLGSAQGLTGDAAAQIDASCLVADDLPLAETLTVLGDRLHVRPISALWA